MSQMTRVLAWVGLVTAVLVTTAALAPDRVAACSCVRQPLAAVAGDPEVVIVAGTISGVHWGPSGIQSGTLAIGRVFKGSVRALRMTIIGEDGGCGRNLDGASEIVMAAGVNGGALTTGCLPFGELSTDEGRQLLAEAVGLFGNGAPTADDIPPIPGTDVGLLAALGLGLAVAVALFAGIARRRRAE